MGEINLFAIQIYLFYLGERGENGFSLSVSPPLES
jgi:hypothetical protein